MRLGLALLCILMVSAGCVGPFGHPTGNKGSGTPHEPMHRTVYGEVLELDVTNRSGRLVVQASVVDCELANRTLAHDITLAEAVDPPAPGEMLGMQLYNTSTSWMLVQTHGWEALVEECAPRHERDVTFSAPIAINGSQLSSGSHEAVRLQYEIVLLGGNTTLGLPISSRQDQPLAVQLANLTLVNNEAFQRRSLHGDASFEQRVENATVRGCAIESPSLNVSLEPQEERKITVTISCSQDAQTRPPFHTCWDGGYAPGAAEGERKYVEAGCGVRVPSERTAAIAGEARFTDELGFEHARAEILWHHLLPARASQLALQAPEVVHERDDVRVVAQYLDARGAPIENASLYLRIDWPGLERHAFPMAYSEADGAYRWTWDDMKEWKPFLWREGVHRVTVEARPALGDEHAPREASVTMTFA